MRYSIAKRRFIVFAISAVAALSPVLYWYVMTPHDVTHTHDDYGRSLDHDACQVPDFDPFIPQAMEYFKRYPTTSCPDGMPTITYFNGQQVKVNMTKKIQAFGKDKQPDCWYRSLKYKKYSNFTHGAWMGPFKEVIQVEGRPEFVEVKCQKEDEVVSRMHHYITRSEERKKAVSPPKHAKEFKHDSMSIMLVCMDSVSRHLFARAMPKTRKYLHETLGAVELQKYTKVADNTMPNLLAIAAGIYTHEIRGFSDETTFDDAPFVWKDYKSVGYRTQYNEDRPNFKRFIKPPTDSFNLPMSVALGEGKMPFDNDCFEDQIEVPLWLNLAIEFARDSLHTTGRFYSMTVMNRPTHDHANKASAVDEHHYNFLKEMYETGLLNNTFYVFFGDHGPRIGEYRRTFYGSVEERAAMMNIYVPKWFREKYSVHYHNLLYNKDRLTTNFDVHETMRHLLSLETGGNLVTQYNNKMSSSGSGGGGGGGGRSNTADTIRRSSSGRQRAFSLFSRIPRHRTCDDAGLAPHWYNCDAGTSVTEPHLQRQIGNQVIEDLNAVLKPKSHLCEKLSLKSVISLRRLGRVGEGWSSLYRIVLTAEPSGGAIEATVQYILRWYFFESIKTLGQPSRLDNYRAESTCVIGDETSMMFCYCKHLTQSFHNIRQD